MTTSYDYFYLTGDGCLIVSINNTKCVKKRVNFLTSANTDIEGTLRPPSAPSGRS